jgi:hexosaminidase
MAFVRYAVIVIILLLYSCNRTSEGKVELHYVIRSIDTVQERMNVTFELINHSSTAFEDASWELHLNQMKGRIIATSLPDGIQYTHINGDNYMKLQFDSHWALRPKDTLIFELQQQGVMDRLAMGPVGVFIAQNDVTRDVETTIIWQKARGLSELEIPTLENRFDRLEGIFLLPKDSIHPLVPKPLTLSFIENKRPADNQWAIDLDSNLNTFRPQLISLMNDLFEQCLDFETNTPSNFFIRYNPSLDSEAYRLDIAQEHITLESASYPGLVYGLQSLHQLIDSADLEGSLWPIAQIEDAPRFGYRGFLLDIARNFYGLPKLKQIVDLMSRMKLNHLDLRLTDDEGWRLEIDGLPELTSVASNRGYTTDERDRLIPMYGSGAIGTPQSNGYLTALEFEELLSYAQVRNVQIIPQISFPSHARAAVKAMESRYYRYIQLNETEKAKEFLLTDFEDKSNYRSAQNYNDNIACICLESAYAFYEKVISSVEQNYKNAEVPLTLFSIGADEVPYGAWQESPICAKYLKEQGPSISSISSLYTSNLKRLKNLFDARGITMAGWEDILLDHSEKSQGETQIASETLDFEVIPYVWNTSWGEGREDMIYKMANAGFTPIMSNSSAFYFDMTDDKDIENYGLNWSGYVDYYDAWAIDPLNVFSNLTLTEKHGLTSSYIAERVRLDPEKRANFLGIQGQLWTETAFNEDILDELLMPNLIVFSERAWASSPEWHQEADAVMQKEWSLSDWNIFSNTLGQRLLPLISHWYPTLNYHLPKPGAKILEGKWQVRSHFPGLKVRYNFTDREPTVTDPIYTSAIDSTNAPQIHLRVFAPNGRGGRSIHTKSHSSY